MFLNVIKENPPKYTVKKSPAVISLKPHNFHLETTTVWNFPERGNWATHNGKYRGNWSPYVPRNIILRYSKQGDVVLDQFVGSGTTLIETKLLRRQGIGVDINPDAVKITNQNIKFQKEDSFQQTVKLCDARNLYFIEDKSIDLICTHPPYANIIKYSKDIEGDLSLLNVNNYLKEIEIVAKECYRVLKPDKYCAILIGDIRRRNHVVPLGFKVMELFINSGFLLKEIIIKEQHNCKSSGFWYEKSIKNNFLLLAHEYLFVFHKYYLF